MFSEVKQGNMDKVHAKCYGFDGFALNNVPKDNLKGATP